MSLDFELWHTADAPLPGMTLDVTQADAQDQEKGHYKVWIDTHALAKGEHVQIDKVIEGVAVAPGDSSRSRCARCRPPSAPTTRSSRGQPPE